MCWLVSCPAGKDIPTAYVTRAQKVNHDGYGLTWFDQTVHSFKTMDFEEFQLKLATLTAFTKVVHLRFTSMGKTNLENSHPFDCGNGAYLFHNGTMTSMKTVACTKTCEDNSDTRNLAEVIKLCKWDRISDIIPLVHQITGTYGNKLVFMESNGEVTIVNKELGKEEDGIWYSNEYHVERTYPTTTTYQPPYRTTYPSTLVKTKVFVYGTLKKGGSNHHYLAASKFLGTATTIGKWAMIGEGMPFPYLLKYDNENGNEVKGEVYEVDATTMHNLNVLEGNPHHYKHMAIGVKMENGSYDTLQTFVKTTVTAHDLSKPFISEFVIANPISTFNRHTEYTLENIPVYTEVELSDLSNYSLRIYLNELERLYYGKQFTTKFTSKEEMIEEILQIYEWFVEEYAELTGVPSVAIFNQAYMDN